MRVVACNLPRRVRVTALPAGPLVDSVGSWHGEVANERVHESGLRACNVRNGVLRSSDGSSLREGPNRAGHYGGLRSGSCLPFRIAQSRKTWHGPGTFCFRSRRPPEHSCLSLPPPPLNAAEWAHRVTRPADRVAARRIVDRLVVDRLAVDRPIAVRHCPLALPGCRCPPSYCRPAGCCGPRCSCGCGGPRFSLGILPWRQLLSRLRVLRLRFDLWPGLRPCLRTLLRTRLRSAYLQRLRAGLRMPGSLEAPAALPAVTPCRLSRRWRRCSPLPATRPAPPQSLNRPRRLPRGRQRRSRNSPPRPPRGRSSSASRKVRSMRQPVST